MIHSHISPIAPKAPSDQCQHPGVPGSCGGAWPVALRIFAQLSVLGLEPSAASVHVAGYRWQGAFLALLEMARSGGSPVVTMGCNPKSWMNSLDVNGYPPHELGNVVEVGMAER